MVANNVKEEPSIILQAVGSGPVKLAFAECREHRLIRSIARVDEENPELVYEKQGFRELVGDGQLALTMLLTNNSTYQGLVSLESNDLLINLENYFKTSEQLATRLKVESEGDVLTGCLLQLLPPQNVDDEEVRELDQLRWNQISTAFKTVDGLTAHGRGVKEYLQKLYPNETIYLDDAIDLSFHCTCSKERSENAMRTLSHAELESMFAEQELVTVSCEFCGETYEFDKFDVESLAPSNLN